MKARDLLSERYGKKGSVSRERFSGEAYSYYFGDIIRNRRKVLKMKKRDQIVNFPYILVFFVGFLSVSINILSLQAQTIKHVTYD